MSLIESYKIYRTGNKPWDLSTKAGFVGGKYNINNLSGGYHGILSQWWEYYAADSVDWLLVSETNTAKQQFQDRYPGKKFTTVDYYAEDIDLRLNLCSSWSSEFSELFNSIVCQATFEHLYDPVTALSNLTRSLKPNGYLFLHTVIPGFVYHQCPEDYFRFYPDWFYAAERFIGNIQVIEMVVVNNHIFVVYQKIN